MSNRISEPPAPFRTRTVELVWAKGRDIRADPANWKLHTDAQRGAYQALLNSVGFVGAVLARRDPDSGGLVALDGHMRIAEHPDATFPVIVTDLEPDESPLVLLTYDTLASMIEAQRDELGALLGSIVDPDPALGSLLEDLASRHDLTWGMGGRQSEEPPEDPGADLDRAEELREKWGVERTQIWEVGRHRLMCGDATSPEDVALLLNGERPRLCLTDPPYGVGIVSHRLGSIGGAKAVTRGTDDGPARSHIVRPNVYAPIEGDEHPFDPTPFVSAGEVVVLWGANYFADKLPSRAGWLVWDKREGDMARNTFAECEMAWTNQDSPARIFRHLWMGLIKGSEHGESRFHPTQKPVALMEWVIEQFTNIGQSVYDPFVGSGTTVVAAERQGRRCWAMEIHPPYVAVVLERMAGMGLEPRLWDPDDG